MHDPAVKRTLTAIVMADVVGYSRMMGEDEAGTLQRLTYYRSALIDPTIARHRGRIVNAIGDSLLLEFGSVVDATLCAVALQQVLIDRNAGLPEAKRIIFRMGVNIGDVIVQDHSLFGDSVNVAARLQTLAEPGGICLSSGAYEQVRGKIDAEFSDMGAHQVKNIARPIEVFALSAGAIGDAQRLTPPVGPARSWRRIALVGGAVCLIAASAVSATFLIRRAARRDLAAQLDTALSASQAKKNDRTRSKLIDDYLALTKHRAFAVAPRAHDHWYTGDWPTAAAAEEKALEKCELAFGEPCLLIALDDELTPGNTAPQTMPRVLYSGDFDPGQIPGVRQSVAVRADVAGYLQAPDPKAAAIHSRGVISIVTGAASQRRAELQALRLCNNNDSSKDSEGDCFLYAAGNKVVLPARQRTAMTRP